jgi:hypothetical protein
MKSGYGDPAPNFVLMRNWTQTFAFRSLCQLALGDAGKAAEELRVVEQFAEGLRGHPLLVSCMIRVAIYGLEAQPFYEGWARAAWSEGEYIRFQRVFERAEFLRYLDFSLEAGEKAGLEEFMANPRDLARLFGGINEDKEPLKALFVNGYFHSKSASWWKKNLSAHHRILDAFRSRLYDLKSGRIHSENAAGASAWVRSEIKKAKPFQYLAEAAIPSLEPALRRLAEAQSSCDQMELVCALERYRIRHGRYPDRLEALEGEFIKSLPRDLITGGVQKYRLEPDGRFTLYAAGWDGIDNGGEGTNSFTAAGGDYSWPYPKRRF